MPQGTVKWFNDSKGFGLFLRTMEKMYLYIRLRSNARVLELLQKEIK